MYKSFDEKLTSTWKWRYGNGYENDTNNELFKGTFFSPSPNVCHNEDVDIFANLWWFNNAHSALLVLSVTIFLNLKQKILLFGLLFLAFWNVWWRCNTKGNISDINASQLCMKIS